MRYAILHWSNVNSLAATTVSDIATELEPLCSIPPVRANLAYLSMPFIYVLARSGGLDQDKRHMLKFTNIVIVKLSTCMASIFVLCVVQELACGYPFQITRVWH